MTLAIHGGKPVRSQPFARYNLIAAEEKAAALRVLDTGVLSGFIGAWHPDFYGGHEVRALEEEWASYFGAKHAVAVNSATSGLFIAIGALGIEPGDEVIVPPYTMSASAVAPLVYNAIPVFADIEENFFCLDPESVAAKITPKTKAIVAVDLFGHPIDIDRLRALADKHQLKIIEDNAQAPLATDRGRLTGLLGDIGVFSLNYHKHIHCGEGGVVVTNDSVLAERMRLIRNHAESVVAGKGETNLVNMIGFNYRMTELEAAVARCQLQKLKPSVEAIRANCSHLSDRLSGLPCFKTPQVRDGCEHSYYVYALRFLKDIAGTSRELFMDAVKAELQPVEGREQEGVNIRYGYVKPLYLLPTFQQKIAFGSRGCPWSCNCAEAVSYARGICPVVERMHFEEVVVLHEYFKPPLETKDVDDVANAFIKVWEQRHTLKHPR